MPDTVYCADCKYWDTQDSKAFSAGLGKCNGKKQDLGCYTTANCPRECSAYFRATNALIDARVREMGE